LTEPNSLAVLRALRRCLRLSPPALPRTSLAAGPPGPDSPALLVCLPGGAAFGFRLRPCLRPASRPTLGTCIRLSSPVPALRRCHRLGLRLTSGPASIWSPARALSSTSGLNLQLLTVCRFSGCRRALVGLASFSFRLAASAFSLALRSRPQFSLATAPAGFAIESCLSSELAPLASTQPSCRLPAPALDAGFAPIVSCHSFRPAFWPASLQRIGSRPCAFVLKRPSGMPLTLRLSRLVPTAPSGPRAGFQSLRPSPSPTAIGPWIVPPQTAPALRPSPLAAANSQWPVDHRALDPRRLAPLRIRPLACSCLRSACASRRFGAGLSVLPRRPRYR